MKVNIGIAVPHTLCGFCQKVHTDGLTCADKNIAGDMLIGYGDFVFCFLDKRDDLLCSFLQDPAFIGQLDPLSAPNKKLFAELCFHILQLP